MTKIDCSWCYPLDTGESLSNFDEGQELTVSKHNSLEPLLVNKLWKRDRYALCRAKFMKKDSILAIQLHEMAYGSDQKIFNKTFLAEANS